MTYTKLIISFLLVFTLVLISTAAQAEEVPGNNSKTVAYYFHGNVRCRTCKNMEAYTREAIDTYFSKQLEKGTLEFKIVNIDESQNEHFVEEFQITTRSVVLVEIVNGKQQRWKTLHSVWNNVGDKQAFLAYVQKEISSYLEAKHE